MREIEATHILVVDDDHAARRMMRKALERRGHRVTEADNGDDALEQMRTTTPDLVLLDLRMPGRISGLGVIAEAKAEAAIAAIPIIIVSASAHNDVRTITRDSGAAAFVEKPVSFQELDEQIGRVLAERR